MSSARVVGEVDRRQVIVAMDADHRRPQDHPDVRFRPDLVDEVLRHALLEIGPADDQGDLARVVREVERCLAGRGCRRR